MYKNNQIIRKQKANNNAAIKKSIHFRSPFVIHFCPLDCICSKCLEKGKGKDLYPAHTHGLTSLGLPEMFIDPLAFGSAGNAYVIQRVFILLSVRGLWPKIREGLNGEVLPYSR